MNFWTYRPQVHLKINVLCACGSLCLLWYFLQIWLFGQSFSFWIVIQKIASDSLHLDNVVWCVTKLFCGVVLGKWHLFSCSPSVSFSFRLHLTRVVWVVFLVMVRNCTSHSLNGADISGHIVTSVATNGNTIKTRLTYTRAANLLFVASIKPEVGAKTVYKE